MRTNFRWIAIALGAAQLISPALSQTDTTATQSGGLLDSSTPLPTIAGAGNSRAWQSTIRDWHSSDWQMTYMGTNVTTGLLEPRIAAFHEVGSGINYIGDNGVWTRSVDLIELMPTNTLGGAAALHGPIKVWFAPTLGADGPTITLTTHSNVVLQVQPVAIYYVDGLGNSALLASFKPDAPGELVPPNQVIYRGVTTNGISASVKYTYTHGAFESDLLMQSQPTQTPDMLGLDPATTRLSLVHFVNGPAPVTTPTLNSVGLSDTSMDFGGVSLPQGYAFSTGGSTDTNQPTPGSPAQISIPGGGGDTSRVPVAKRIIPVGPGQWGLAEDVRWVDIKSKLGALPPYGQGAMLREKTQRSAGVEPKRGANRKMNAGDAQIQKLLASVAQNRRGQAEKQASFQRPAKENTHHLKPMKVASFALEQHQGEPEKAVDLDFVTVVSGGNYVFSANQTYFLSSSASFTGSVDLYGAVIKEAPGAYLWCSGPVNCHGNSTNLTIITSMHDWAVGENGIPNSTGYPVFSGAPALRLSYTTSPQTLNWLKIRFGQTGLEFDGNGTGMTHTLLNSSLEWCQTGITNYGCTVSLQNCTKCNTTNALAGSFIGTLSDASAGNDPANG
jgi:hypothetical protein